MTTPAAQTQADGIPSWITRLAPLSVLAAVVLIPLVYDPWAKDAFRGPKEYALRAIAIVLSGLAVLAVAHAPRTAAALRRIRTDVVVALAIVGWTAVTTLLSTNRLVSSGALLTVSASAVFYLGARLVTSGKASPWYLDVLFIPALLNSGLAILQALRIWQPLSLPEEIRNTRLSTVALLGNPNDVGIFLVPSLLAAFVAAVQFRGRRRAIYVLVTLVIAAGVTAAGTRGAFLGLLAAFAVMTLALGRRFIIAGTVILAILIALAVVPGTPLRSGLEYAIGGWDTQRLDILFSNRLPPFLAAWEMTKAEPVTGVGAGAFGYNFMEYHRGLHGKYPAKWLESWQMNFAFVHNDHLQVSAETGVPGYILFLASAALLAAVTLRRKRASDPLVRVKYALALPLAVGLLATCVTQFPLQVAAARCMFLYACAWCRSVEDIDA